MTLPPAVLTFEGTFEFEMFFVTYSAFNLFLFRSWIIFLTLRLDLVDLGVLRGSLTGEVITLLLLNVRRHLVEALDVGFDSHTFYHPGFDSLAHWIRCQKCQEVEEHERLDRTFVHLCADICLMKPVEDLADTLLLVLPDPHSLEPLPH